MGCMPATEVIFAAGGSGVEGKEGSGGEAALEGAA